MKIVGTDNSNKKKWIILSVICVIALVSLLGVALYLKNNSQTQTKPEPTEEEIQAEKTMKEKYKEAGIDLEDDQELQKQKEENNKKLKEIGAEDIGQIAKDSVQEQRYKGVSIDNEISKVIQESRGLESPTNDGTDGTDTEEDKEQFSENNEQGADNEEDDTVGETINEDLKDIDKLMATATIEVRTTMKIISDSLNRSLNNNSDPYNSALLKETLDRARSGGSEEHAGIDSLTYADFFNTVKYWLFHYPDYEFSWKMIDQASGLYKNILLSSLYERDFSSITNQVIQIVDDGSEIDGEYVSFTMVFYSNSKVYKGVFGIQDNMPRLLDLMPL